MPATCFPVWFRSCQPLGLGVALAGLAGCAHPLPPAEYRAWLADPAHGLTQTQEVAGTTIICAYRPTELLVLQDLGTAAGRTTPAQRDSVARAYAGKTYCVLTLSKNGGEVENQFLSNRPVYEQVLTYLNSGIAADVVLATPPDSTAALASMYLRQFGATGSSTVLLVFNTHDRPIVRGFTMTLHGQKLGLGTQRFAFTGSSLAALPELAFTPN